MEKSENDRDNPHMPGCIVFACDATKDRNKQEFKNTISNIQMRGGIIQAGDKITVLGVVHKILHPLGYQMKIGHGPFFGTHVRAMEEESSRKIDSYVDIEAKITVGSPMKKVVAKEVKTSNATWVVLDRHLRKELKYFLKHTPCKVAMVLDDLSLEVLRPYSSNKDVGNIEHTLFYSLSKPVNPLFDEDNETIENLLLTFGSNAEGENNYSVSLLTMDKQKSSQRSSGVPVLSTGNGMNNGIDSIRFSYSEIKIATDNFSSDNLLGEGRYGVAYKGQLKDGKLVTAKVLKEASTQGSAEFHSEVYARSFARHKNIVPFLGYCCKKRINILVYEYICDKSLEWHLFDNTGRVLEWHRRRAIAIEIAQALCYLHEECQGFPIIHLDVRPCQILLTHDFVSMLRDCGLAKWKIDETVKQTRIFGTPGYVAPEYTNNGIVSVQTDVYAFGIVLIQLISGRRIVNSPRDDHFQSIKQWALPLIQTLALDNLVDPRLGDSYRMYELYNMARTAYLCVQTDPKMRPSMGEVLHLMGNTT